MPANPTKASVNARLTKITKSIGVIRRSMNRKCGTRKKTTKRKTTAKKTTRRGRKKNSTLLKKVWNFYYKNTPTARKKRKYTKRKTKK